MHLRVQPLGRVDQFDTNGFDLGDANRTLLGQLTQCGSMVVTGTVAGNRAV